MNTFVQPYVAGTQALVTCPLYDPRSVRANRARFRRDAIPALDRANSICIPTGRWPTRGWILLARSDYNNLNKYATNFQLNVGDPTQPNNIDTLNNLSIVQAQCVTSGLASDLNAIYLVELTDARGLAHNKWFQYPSILLPGYNIRSPAYPQTFFPDSMNGGTTWTWNTMLQNMWNRMSTILGSWPGLPAGVTITGTPEGFWFPGVPLWYALNDILEFRGLTVACDLTQSSPFTVVSAGAADAAFTALKNSYAVTTSPLYALEDDQEWIDTGAGRVPATVVILFRRRNQYYGTEETVTYRNDTWHQWEMTPFYSVSVSSPAAFSSAVGSHYLWSDFTVQYDMDNNPLAADTATAATIASELVTQYFAKIYRQTAGYMAQTFAGALPFVTGSQVDGVKFYQDFIDQGRMGWKTKIVRGPYPPFQEIYNA